MKCQNMMIVKNRSKHVDGLPIEQRLLKVPCGKCAICKTNKRLDWTIRLMEESKQHQASVFVTLTYNEDEVPQGLYSQTLWKEDIRRFIKSLRNAGYKIRYYILGEYGSNGNRPHYHIMLFGLADSDSLNIQKHWNKGFITCEELTFGRCWYISKYHVLTDKDEESNYGREPPFTLQSLKPGIGSGYIDKMKPTQSKNIEQAFYQNFQHKLRLPRYYKDRIYTKAQRNEITENFLTKNMNFDEIDNYISKNGETWFENHFSQVQGTEERFNTKNKNSLKI